MPTSDATPSDPVTANGIYLRPFSRRLGEVLIQGERAHFVQGEYIDEACRGQYWERWPGGALSFKDWCWQVLGFRSRKAQTFRRNWQLLSGLNVAEDTLVRALRLGWTKLARILPVSPDEVSLIKWIDRIENDRLTEDDLRILTRIGGPPAPAADGADEREPAERPKAFRIVFEDKSSHDTFMLALKAIKKRYDPEMGWGRAAALMATSYAASMPRDDEGGAPVELNDLISMIETTHRTRLVVADDQPVPQAPRAVVPAMIPNTSDAVRSASLEM